MIGFGSAQMGPCPGLRSGSLGDEMHLYTPGIPGTLFSTEHPFATEDACTPHYRAMHQGLDRSSPTQDGQPGSGRQSGCYASDADGISCDEGSSRRYREWSMDERQRLHDAVHSYRSSGRRGGISWKNVSAVVGTRSWEQCRERWRGVEEYFVETLRREADFDSRKARLKIVAAKSRSHSRYHKWTEPEERLLLALAAQHCCKWREIAESFPGLSPAVLKNKFFCLRRRAQGAAEAR